jgi:hypothetical protein
MPHAKLTIGINHRKDLQDRVQEWEREIAAIAENVVRLARAYLMFLTELLGDLDEDLAVRARSALQVRLGILATGLVALQCACHSSH